MPEDDEEAPEIAPGAENDEAHEARRRRRLVYGGLGLGAFFISAIVALSAGGHFQRRPLCGLRHVPLIGGLIPSPPQPEQEQQPEDEDPTLAALRPVLMSEIKGLIEALEQAREGYRERLKHLRGDEERLRALQHDLGEERSRLDKLMADVLARRVELDAERKALRDEIIVATSEERKRIVKLARYFESQEPLRAAAELEELDRSGKDELAVKTLAQMQEKRAAKIFDAMQPGPAAKLKEKISRLRYQQDKKQPAGTGG